MIDTHCHLFEEYYSNIEKIILDAKEKGVEKIIINGTNRKTNEEVLEIIKKDPCLYGTIGFYPDECNNVSQEDYNFLSKNINNPKIVGIGEIGLDFHYDNYNKEKQIEIFKKQLGIACQNSKPVIIHCRDASFDTYNIIKDYNIPKVLHCYSGSLDMAKLFIKSNCFLGIGGIITFSNAKKLVNVVKNIDLKYLVMETDSPYLTPEPYRGKVNEPAYIEKIAKKISEIKQIDLTTVCETTNRTTKSIFDFNNKL